MIVRQRKRYDCGQCCIAMLTECSYEKAVEAVGHANATNTKTMVRAIRSLEWDCDDRLYHSRTQPVDMMNLTRALVKVTFPRRSGWHWIAVIEGQRFDPSHADSLALGRMTSFLEVK